MKLSADDPGLSLYGRDLKLLFPFSVSDFELKRVLQNLFPSFAENSWTPSENVDECDPEDLARERSRPIGPVRSIVEEVAALAFKSGKWQQGQRRFHFLETYDVNGKRKKTERAFYGKEGLDWKRVCAYDRRGIHIEQANFDAQGSLKRKDVYVPRVNKNDVEYIGTPSPGFSRVDKVLYRYDKSGHLLEQIFYVLDGETASFLGKRTHEYDDNGKRLRSEDTLGPKRVYLYDANERLMEVNEYLEDGGLAQKRLNSYDMRGNRVERAFYKADGSLYGKELSRYQFDEHGNWIKQTTIGINMSMGFRWAMVTYRTISYY